MKLNNGCLWIVLLCSFATHIRSELLIVQRGASGFEPIPAESGKNDEIRTILEQYQWPQCIINSENMTEQEKADLLSSGKPYAEERFIRQKIQQLYPSYDVIFFPTALYELFALLCIFHDNWSPNPFEKEVEKLFFESFDSYFYDLHQVNYPDIIKQKGSTAAIIKKVNKTYGRINTRLFESGSWGYINNTCVEFLFRMFPGLKSAKDAFTASQSIQRESNLICEQLLARLAGLRVANKKNPHLMKSVVPDDNNMNLLFQIIKKAGYLFHITKKIIELEYEAREINNALLLRGASFRNMQVGFGPEPKQAQLVGSTLARGAAKKEGQEELKEAEQEWKPSSVEQAYGTKTLHPFSISFGNSFFAGALRDFNASAYYFFMGGRALHCGELTPEGPLGYALFIDKKAYVEHRLHNLFIIPGLMTLAGLVASGEYFHPRTTVAVHKKDKGAYEIQGLDGAVIDPNGFLIITRDPLRHAELFSRYLAQHGKIVQMGGLEGLSEDEQKFAQDVLRSQEQAAQFYKTTRKFKGVIDKKTKRMRARKQKQVQQEVPVNEEVEV
jgi:hypothetical protein